MCSLGDTNMCVVMVYAAVGHTWTLSLAAMAQRSHIHVHDVPCVLQAAGGTTSFFFRECEGAPAMCGDQRCTWGSSPPT